ncbi:MAG: lipoprotein insertase outer membrane protein LolB [Lysobacter sp.]
MNVRILALAAIMLLTACVARPVREALPSAQSAAAEAQQLAREGSLRQQPAWSLQGRIAVSNGRKGGSGRIDWLQDGGRFDVSLSAPVTRQSWRLSGDSAWARLEGLDGGMRDGPDAVGLLREATGWEIPLTALVDWIRGVRAQGADKASAVYGLDGRLQRIEQGGWTIDYHWPLPGSDIALNSAQSLPVRLDARRGDASVRLIIDQWVAGVH